MTDLPLLDIHTTFVRADPGTTWTALTGLVERGFTLPGATSYARLVRCEDTTAGGPRPLAVGSTIPGFRVAEAIAGARLELRGRHAFSDYSLAFVLDGSGEGTHLAAESRAVFPGAEGSFYRTLVIGTRGHMMAVRRLLESIRKQAEK